MKIETKTIRNIHVDLVKKNTASNAMNSIFGKVFMAIAENPDISDEMKRNIKVLSFGQYHGKRGYNYVCRLIINKSPLHDVDGVLRNLVNRTQNECISQFVDDVKHLCEVISTVRFNLEYFDIIGFYTDDDANTILTIAR